MKITRLIIDGFQGLSHLDLSFDQTVALIAGHNACGKTTIRDAITFALTGQSGRVSLKKDYSNLVRRGADPKKARVKVEIGGFSWSRAVATGKADGDEPDVPIVLPYLLGSQSFTALERGTQTKLLMHVSKVRADHETVKKMLAGRGIEDQIITEVAPMLRSGFSAAVKYCKDKQSEARGGWSATTGETFGATKADGWTAPASELDPKAITKELADCKEGLESLDEELTEARSAEAANPQHTHSSGTTYECPACEAKLVILSGKLVPDERKQETKPDLEAMKAAKDKITDLARQQATMQQRIGTLRAQLDQANNADRLRKEKEEQAAMYFKVWGWWGDCADALGPSGIPLEITEQATGPVNDRLAATCKETGWPLIEIQSDLGIRYGATPYALCSESEQWRVDAAVSEALSSLSGVKFFVLDRFDVLDFPDRSVALKWLLSVQDDHDSIIVLATLKQAPKAPGVQCEWLERSGQARKAA